MEIIVQWATILSPIIAVVLAWWMGRSGAKQTVKQVASIKELEKIQINLLQLQIDKEMNEAKVLREQASEKVDSMRNSYILGGFPDSFRQVQERKTDIENEKEYHSERLHWLYFCQTKLDEMKKQVTKS